MSDKEAKARIKINKLLEDAGWRFSIDVVKKSLEKYHQTLFVSEIDKYGEFFSLDYWPHAILWKKLY